MEDAVQDICRVCRSEGAPDKPLYHPCVCTGSIKFIHQECLVQWLKYSKKEYCELCKHRFSFTPIYSPDMPRRLPIKDIITGLLKSVGRAIRYWFHYTLVAIAWLGIVPLTACRIYRCLFTGSVSSLLTLPMDMLSTENLLSDCFQGCFVVTCTLCAFISLVWLREQILHGGGPDWLEHDNNNHPNNVVGNNIAQVAAGVLGNGGGNNVIGQVPPQPAAPNAENAGDAGAAPAPVVDDQDAQDNAGLGGGGNLGNNVAQEDNWIPIELDRAAEELTWERLLGLDGSLVFLEHVFWVVSLNTLFILVFAFCPYHIGHFIIIGLKSEDWLSPTQFEGLLTTLLGYLVIAASLVVLHTVFSIARLRRSVVMRSKRVLGLCYIVIKVSLLVVIEIGIFPIFCGLWLDICSLVMFDASWKDRELSFRLAPGTLMFIHWLVGMVYVFYFASFILLLREVLRPGVLWFLRNLNDPDFNPIQEMIHLPIYRHIRRFIASMVIFGSTVIVMLWLPIRTVKYLMPNFLPYNVMLSSDAPVSELSLELLLLQVVLPALLEQGHTRQWLKNLVRGWCIAVSWLLDLRSFLLGDIPMGDERKQEQEQANDNGAQVQQPEEDPLVAPNADPRPAGEQQPADLNADDDDDEEIPELVEESDEDEEEEEEEEEEAEEAEEAEIPAAALPPPGRLQAGLAAAHQALLQGGGPTGFQPYVKPQFFQGKLVALMVLMCITLFLASLISLIVPVFIGRSLMSLWMGEVKIHELYTAGCGLYTCWLSMRAVGVLQQWLPQGMGAVMLKIKEWTVLALKSLIVASLLIGLVPLLIGLLFELVVVIPLRVPLDQTPIIFPWQDWALGVLHAKIACAITMMGPQSWLKTALEQVYNLGLRNMDLKFIIRELCIPVITCLSLCLAGPYIIAKSIVPMFGLGFEVENLVLRHIYSFLVAIMSLISFCIFQARQFSRLYEHIKNDKYLVGQRLVNYDRPGQMRPRDVSVS